MKQALKLTTLAAAAGLLATPVQAQGLDIVFTHHSSASNPFWQAVKKGFDEACDLIDAQCQMIFTQTEGSIEQQVANMQAAIARQPDAIITSIVDNGAFDGVIDEARKNGIIVIGSNVDDLEGGNGNARQAFIGQGFIPAGYSLGKAMSDHFPDDGPINVIVGVNAPGQNWSEQRAAGVISFLEEFKGANPDRQIEWQKVDAGNDMAVVGQRIGALINANPDTTAYFDTGLWHVAVARFLNDQGRGPGEVLLGGFDLVPEVLQQMEAGYIQVQIDQQPYLQGYIPVIQANLMKSLKLSAWNVDTGQGVVTPDDVADIMPLSAQGYR